MQFAPGIHRIEAPLGDRFVALYLFVGARAVALVDTGLDGSIAGSVLPYMRDHGIDPLTVRYIVSTHCDFDHVGGNREAVREFSNATLMSHVSDQPLADDVERLIADRYGEFLPEHGYDDVDDAAKSFIRDVTKTFPADVAVTGGERLRLADDWTIDLVHTPGHSWGSLSVWDSRSRTIVIGDAVLGRGLLTTEGEPAFPPTYRYVDDYRTTIDRLMSLDISWLGTAHYPLLSSGASAFLTDSLAYTNEVETEILAELARVGTSGLTAMEIIESCGARLGSWPSASPLMYPVVGHLEELVGQGKVARVGNEIPSRWALR